MIAQNLKEPDYPNTWRFEAPAALTRAPNFAIAPFQQLNEYTPASLRPGIEEMHYLAVKLRQMKKKVLRDNEGDNMETFYDETLGVADHRRRISLDNSL